MRHLKAPDLEFLFVFVFATDRGASAYFGGAFFLCPRCLICESKRLGEFSARVKRLPLNSSATICRVGKIVNTMTNFCPASLTFFVMTLRASHVRLLMLRREACSDIFSSEAVIYFFQICNPCLTFSAAWAETEEQHKISGYRIMGGVGGEGGGGVQKGHSLSPPPSHPSTITLLPPFPLPPPCPSRQNPVDAHDPHGCMPEANAADALFHDPRQKHEQLAQSIAFLFCLWSFGMGPDQQAVTLQLCSMALTR